MFPSSSTEPSGPPTLPIETLPPDTTDEVDLGGSGPRRRTDAGSRRRRNQALVVVGIAVASAAAGIGVGTQLKSPAERAAERQPPVASRVTVPVERRSLAASVAISGSIEFDEPFNVRLAGPVGASAGSTQVLTKVPEQDAAIAEGQVLAEISGRPVFVFQGALPVFRSMEPGVTGPDVAQLEAALVRLGFDPGPVDEVYDDATESAIDAFYLAAGYASEGPSEEQRKALREAQKAVVQAEQGVATARDALAKGGEGTKASERLQAQQTVQRATDAVPTAEATAKRENDAAASKVTTDTGLRDAAKTARDAAATILTNASVAGAINPETQAEYTASEIAGLKATLAERDTSLLTAQQSLNESLNAQTTTAANGIKSIQEAKDALALAQLQLTEALKPVDTTSLKEAVTAAQAVLDQARLDAAAIQADSGTKLPAGEMVFVPTLPSTITGVSANALPGFAVPTDSLATLSSTETRVTARVSRGDAGLLEAGMPVAINIRDAGIETTGVIASIGVPESTGDPGTGQGGDSGTGSGAGSGSGGSAPARLQVVVTPDDPTILADWVFSTARLSIAVSSTDGEVLAVPVAAVFVGPDGSSRVEVERVAATDDDPGSTELVDVEVGLSAQGFVEISPLNGELEAGDRVVVGNADSGGTDDETSDTEPDADS